MNENQNTETAAADVEPTFQLGTRQRARWAALTNEQRAIANASTAKTASAALTEAEAFTPAPAAEVPAEKAPAKRVSRSAARAKVIAAAAQRVEDAGTAKEAPAAKKAPAKADPLGLLPKAGAVEKALAKALPAEKKAPAKKAPAKKAPAAKKAAPAKKAPVKKAPDAIENHIAEVFKKLPAGTFLKARQVTNTVTSVFPDADKRPSDVVVYNRCRDGKLPAGLTGQRKPCGATKN